MKSYMKYRLSKFTFIMCCNAEIIFFSDEIRAKMPQKLAKQNHTYTYMLLITHIGVRAGGARGAAAPPKFGQLRFFGQQEKIWAKPVFKDVSMFFIIIIVLKR